ncbi:MAG: flagellar export chaperone FliS [Desulfovibrionaceae bacterium]|nr:flagellar export chaperone FliS [Desulfovibrionaceae bacterium]
MQRAASAYLQTQVTTTSQGDLVVMLYDGAIKFLNQAKGYLAANDMAKKGIAISKALDVINEMDSTLNMDKGGSLAGNLHGLYLFCSNHLVKANLKKDPAMIDDVIRVLSGLRAAYSQILTTPEAQAAAQQAAANLRATAILPPRAQAGTATSGGEAPAPGANARIRAMYAKQQTGETVPAAPEETAGNATAQPPEAQAGVEMPPPQAQGNGFGSRAQSDLLRKLSVS